MGRKKLKPTDSLLMIFTLCIKAGARERLEMGPREGYECMCMCQRAKDFERCAKNVPFNTHTHTKTHTDASSCTFNALCEGKKERSWSGLETKLQICESSRYLGRAVECVCVCVFCRPRKGGVFFISGCFHLRGEGFRCKGCWKEVEEAARCGMIC